MAGAGCALLGAAILALTIIFTRGVAYGTNSGPRTPDPGPANRYGVNVELDKIVRDRDLQRSVDMIQAAGFGFARQVFAWNEIEISAKGDFYDHKNAKSAWDKYDRLVDAGNAAGLQFIARLERPPQWARAAGTAVTAPPQNFDDYGDFVAAFVQHFKGRIHYIQIWNEPNRFEDWGNQPVDPAAYTKLLRIAYARAKDIDPSIVVLSAALTPTTDCCTKNRPDPVYLQEMYDAGARGSFDVLGAQAYGLRAGPEDPWQDLPWRPNDARKAIIDSHNTNFGRVVLDRQVMVRNGDAGKSVWVCEFGWNALPTGWTGDASPWGSVSLDRQASYTVQAYQRAQREWPWLGVMNLWLFQDPTPAATDPTQFFGLVDQQFQPRPVYDAIRTLTHAPPAAASGQHSAANAAASYAGAWAVTASGRTSPVSGATATLRFSGSAVSLRTARGPGMGIAYLAVDGSPTYATELPKDSAGRAALDLYAPSASPAVVSVASGLPAGPHELTLTVSGLHDPSSTGPAVEVDGFATGLTRDQRPYYAGALLFVLGIFLLAKRLTPSRPTPSPAAAGEGRGEGALGAPVPTPSPTASATRVGPKNLAPPRLGSVPSEGVTFAFQALALAILYFGRPLPVTALGAAAFLVLALVRLETALVFIPLAIPFYLLPIHIRNAEVPLSEALIALTLAAYLIRGWSRRIRWPRTAFTWPAALFFLAATGSVLAAAYPRYALREWRTDVVEPLLFFALIVLVRPRVKPMLNALLAGGLLVALAGFVQYALRHGIQAEGVLRMVGVYRSPDNFALYLARLVPVAAALGLLAPMNKRWRAIYLTGAALGLGGVLLSFTRGAWIGVFVALLVVAAFAGRRWLAAGLLGGAVAAAAISTLQARRIQSLFEFAPGTTGFTRIELWRATVRMIADHPLFGVGLDNFLYQYPRYILPDARNEPDLSHPHNLLLDFWSRIGIFGLAALVWLEIVFFRMAARVIRSGKGFQRAAAIGLLASMVDCLVHGLVDNSYFLIDLSLLFWLTAGLLQLLEWGSPDHEENAA
ncbi:MAG TPA: O-antigen ligase family protein [Chloroflexota bacterium]|nr:O-antigen ligase family protein [Chloroflexota bacterium]